MSTEIDYEWYELDENRAEVDSDMIEKIQKELDELYHRKAEATTREEIADLYKEILEREIFLDDLHNGY